MSIDTKSNQEQVANSLPIAQQPAVPAPTKSHGELVAKVGTVLSAILASSCCWLPLLLLALGVSGAGIASALATYRPLFIAVTVAFLGAAFYFTYRPKRMAKGSQGSCCSPNSAASDCCAPAAAQVDCCGNPIVAFNDNHLPVPARQPRMNMLALNKIMLWVVTVMAILFMFFPGYVSMWLGARNDVITGNMRRVELKVDGMFCEGCAPIAAKALKKVPGVLAVEIDYDNSRATVGMDPDRPINDQALIESLKKVRFDGKLAKGS